MVNDTIADMLVRIKNATMSKSDVVSLPTSKMCVEIAKILKKEGFINGFEEKQSDKSFKELVISLKYDNQKNSVISGVKRISKPGLRITTSADKLPKVYNGLGIAIISTSSGVLTDKECRNKHVGGEVLAFVW